MSAFEPDYRSARLCPSPNCGERKGGRTPDMLILHYTGMPTAQAALDWLCSEESQVSSLLLRRRGRSGDPAAAGIRACMACRPELLEGRDRHQFVLDRHRDRQSRPRSRFAGFRGGADRAVIALCRDIVERTRSQPSGCWRIPTSRPCASRIRAKCFPGQRLHRRGHRPLGRTVAGRRRAVFPGRRRRPAGGSAADHACAVRLPGLERGRGLQCRDGCRGAGVSAPFPPPTGRRHRRCLDHRHICTSC
jgi:hypothetical protein